MDGGTAGVTTTAVPIASANGLGFSGRVVRDAATYFASHLLTEVSLPTGLHDEAHVGVDRWLDELVLERRHTRSRSASHLSCSRETKAGRMTRSPAPSAQPPRSRHVGSQKA